MRRPILAANWKMYKTRDEVAAFVAAFRGLLGSKSDAEAVIAPPFTALDAARQRPHHCGAGEQADGRECDGVDQSLTEGHSAET